MLILKSEYGRCYLYKYQLAAFNHTCFSLNELPKKDHSASQGCRYISHA
jgi:hypothetical protein